MTQFIDSLDCSEDFLDSIHGYGQFVIALGPKTRQNKQLVNGAGGAFVGQFTERARQAWEADMTTNGDPFEQFLIRLAPDMTSPFERYKWLRARMIKFFQWRYCEDAEGLADETIGRLVANVYAGNQIDSPSSYAYGTAMNVFRENTRKEARLMQIQRGWEVAIGNNQTSADPNDSAECARLCLEKLSDDKRLVLEQYYSDDVDRGQLASQLGSSLAAMRTKIHRLKAELRECYDNCMKGPV